MPELVQDSTPPAVPPAVPATIDPSTWEDYPLLRETGLMYVSDPFFNTALRTASEHFFRILLEHYDRWPAWEESSTRTEFRAGIADLRHLQGFMASVGQERNLSSLDPGDAKLSKHASQVARLLKQVADTMERKLAKGAA
jgi:hypothetical protein